MLVFDQLKRDDRRLQVIAAGILLGMLVLMVGLWWVQIVSSKRYEANLKNQSFRSVRVPALRGDIYDRNGKVLAENRPRYDVNFYLEEILDYSRFMFTNNVVPEYRASNPDIKKIPGKVYSTLILEARYRAVSNITHRVTSTLDQPHILEPKRFFDHLVNYPYMPFPIAHNLTLQQVAIFSEQFNAIRGLELEVRPIRSYPNGATAAHLLGRVQRDDRPDGDEQIAFKYYLPDFAGRTGMEGLFDSELRGKAGVKSLLVNNVGYRQSEEIVSQTKPGKNLSLTIDLELQAAAEKALAGAQAKVQGAVVVMNVRNGDVLALVSLPTFDPNAFPNGISHADWARLNDEKYSHIFNRATYGAYAPGSIFKIITAVAILESGVDPKEKFTVESDPARPGKGAYYVGRRKIKDTAPSGEHDFERAFKLSSNSYFIHYGLQAGLPKLIEVGKRFHLGERTGAFPGQEPFTDYPTSQQGWSAGDIANLCIGQGKVSVTPLQMACMTAAIANGGRILYPRLVKSVDGNPLDDTYRQGVRTNLKLNSRHVDTIQRAMLADVVDTREGTGRAAYIPNFHVGGKTGTAEVQKAGRMDTITWFASYGPFEDPKYAVVVMVESGASGGGTCAPVARKIYEAIQKREGTTPNFASLNLD
ncbi:MAG: hypothetical protein H0X66_12345 [Verrucomicrobia bacterium]|nr:hypothetical protein [Verrucomicrobiota bacterium]